MSNVLQQVFENFEKNLQIRHKMSYHGTEFKLLTESSQSQIGFYQKVSAFWTFRLHVFLLSARYYGRNIQSDAGNGGKI